MINGVLATLELRYDNVKINKEKRGERRASFYRNVRNFKLIIVSFLPYFIFTILKKGEITMSLPEGNILKPFGEHRSKEASLFI